VVGLAPDYHYHVVTQRPGGRIGSDATSNMLEPGQMYEVTTE
jgi:hypothetical protein